MTANVSATHEALVESLTTADAANILGKIRDYATVTRHLEPGQEPNVQAEMYKVVSELVSGELSAHDLHIPAEFVQNLQHHREAALERVNTQVREATESALRETLNGHSAWRQELESHGTGATPEAKLLDAINKFQNGEGHISMSAAFTERFEATRRNTLLQLPETSLIATTLPGYPPPIGIGLTAHELAGTQRLLQLIRRQDDELQGVHAIPEAQKAQFFETINHEALAATVRAGVPHTLQPLFQHTNQNSDEIEAMAFLANQAIAGDVSPAHAQEEEHFLNEYLQNRQRLLESHLQSHSTS